MTEYDDWACFARQEFVPNMMWIVLYVSKKVVIGVSSQLRQCGVVHYVQAEPDSTSYGCFETLLVSRAGKTPPCR